MPVPKHSVFTCRMLFLSLKVSSQYQYCDTIVVDFSVGGIYFMPVMQLSGCIGLWDVCQSVWLLFR